MQGMTNVQALLSDPLNKLLDNLSEREDYISLCSEKIGLYKSPKHYASWDFYLKMVSLMGSEYMSRASFYEKDYQSGIISEICRQALRENAPARYISKELCEAFMRTPTPILSQEILEVLPYFHIILPRHFVYDSDQEEVIAIVVKAGELHPRLTEKQRAEQEEYNKYLGGKTIPSILEGARGIEVATISETGSYFWLDYVDEHAKSWYDTNIRYREGREDTEASSDIEKIARIAVNSLLVHLYEPELITTDKPESPTRALGFASSPTKQPLPPTWIGKSFRYQREQQKKNTASKDERKSVRAHWRKGHWHRVNYGVKKKQSRIQWYRPVYVRGESTN